MPAKVDHIYTSAADDHVVGEKNAKSEVIIYASVTCPHCKDWFDTEWPKFKAAEVDTGRTKFVFREYPTAPADLALAEFCIANGAKAGTFMDQIMYQYDKQREILTAYRQGEGEQAIVAVANNAGLNTVDEIQACLNDPDIQAHLKHSMQRGNAGGVQGTPTFIVGGKLYNGPSYAAEVLTIATEAARA